ncbi:hypothetical protein GF385_04730 [Candidatus Dependentiae bacterium]|nr:hypothetical protein [Candidatus Dependentiae bacterium]
MKIFKLIIFIIFSTNSIFAKKIDSKKYIKNLYKNTSGFSIPQKDREYVNKYGSAVYGEITYDSLKILLDDLKPKTSDVFYDLGSGVGKVTVQATLDYKFKKAFGIELSRNRHLKAEKIRAKLKKAKKIKSHHNLFFKHEDISKTNLKSATIIFMCSTCFPKNLMEKLAKNFAKLRKKTKILTLKKLPENKKLQLLKTYNLEMTWSKNVTVYLYQKI